jgi:hypothetical protein
MNEDDEIIRILNSSKDHCEALQAVSAFVRSLRKEGQTKEAILARLEALRSSVSEEQEDVLLDVVDLLVGWCNPNMRID